MTISELMNILFDLKRKFPDLYLDPKFVTYGQSTVTVTLPVSDDHAALLVQAISMFAPSDEPLVPLGDPWNLRDDEPPF